MNVRSPPDGSWNAMRKNVTQGVTAMRKNVTQGVTDTKE